MKNIGRIVAAERRKFLQLGAAAAGAASFGLAGAAQAQRAKVFRLGHNLPVDTVYHKACMMLAEEVGNLSHGRMRVDIYPTSQLGGIAEMMSAVKTGSLSMMMAVPAWYSNYMKPMDVFTLPFIINRDNVALRAALNGKIAEVMGKIADSAGFYILGYLLIGGRHILNRARPINTPADLKGLKIRVINSQVYIQTFQALGATPVAMDAAEIYLALQQNAVDGFETAAPDVLAFKWNEVVKYMCLDAHVTDIFIISVNKGLWEGLSKNEQDVFHQAFAKAADYEWVAQPKAIDEAVAKLRTLIGVNDISPENKKLFIEATRPVYAKFEASIGKEIVDLALKELA
jgi:tripartite ATP-independent transporter DctP family solute receptor